mgnify:CR=1 FL=1
MLIGIFAATFYLAVVTRLPFAAAAGGQEHADQQAEQENQAVDDPYVRIVAFRVQTMNPIRVIEKLRKEGFDVVGPDMSR